MTLNFIINFEEDTMSNQDSKSADLHIINPFTEETYTVVKNHSAAEVNDCVQKSKVAFSQWRTTTGAERAVILDKIAEEILAHKDELSLMETNNCGKPIMESEWDMDDVAACFTYYAKLARELDSKQDQPVDVGSADYECSIRLEPAGVVGCIVPFNYPLLMAAWKSCAALAAGCAVLLKPSELTPLTALKLGEIAFKCGLPKNVLTVVTGDRDTGKAIVEHPDIVLVAFTGSVSAGIHVATMSAPTLKQSSLELGGKSAAIVFADCDLDKAAEWVCFGCWWTNGQICSATSRLLVEESIKEEFVGKLKSIAEGIQIGDPTDRDCRMGPVVSRAQRDKIFAMIARGISQGATLLQGSSTKPQIKGFFVEPTLLEMNSKENSLWNEEVFGPVLSIMSFTSEKEALALANDSKFGLAGAVFSSDVDKLKRCTNLLEVGIVWQNASQPCFVQLPWGGRKASGYSRDLGEWGLAKYLEPKQVVKYVSREPLGWYK